MKVNIYAIIHPNTDEVVYVGQTPNELSYYLKTKYWKLKEVKRGNRNWTPLFKFLDKFPIDSIKIKTLKVVDTNDAFSNPDFFEKYYIKMYKDINPNLLNVTDGGIGGNTYKYKTKEDISEIGKKVSKKLKGRKKPDGFAEHLSIIRKGINNPAAKPLSRKIRAYSNNVLVKEFNYGFEINDFIGSKHAYSNVVKTFNTHNSAYGYKWV